MSDALKPCPFCGSNEVHVVEAGPGNWVSCLDCDSDGPVVGTIEKAVAAWNTRAALEQPGTAEAQARALDVLASISSMCVANLAMDVSLDAHEIGQMIYEATGMTEPELAEAKRLREEG